MKLELTPNRRENIAEALRAFTPEIDEAAVQRALFAIWPPVSSATTAAGVEVCTICGTNLATRPVLSEVHNPARGRALRVFKQTYSEPPDRLDLPPATIARNVSKKPLQLVITSRIEGSYGDRQRAADLPAVSFRFCLDCLDKVKP